MSVWNRLEPEVPLCSSVLPFSAFWSFFRRLTQLIRSSESVDFVVDLTRHYFSSATRYVCFLYPYGSALCQEEEPAPRAPHPHQSLIVELALTLGEIATP